MSPKILVADDEQNIVRLLRLYLRNEGFDVVAAADGRQALERFGQEAPDLVLLDLMMPHLSGFEVCTEIRKKSDVPVIMLTARSDDVDKIVGLEMGADDYVTKPFNPREVVARVKAALRRRHWDREAGDDEAEPEAVTIGNVTLDPSSRDVTVAGARVRLRQREFDLLEAFLRHPNVVLDRERLLRLVWGQEYEGDTRTIDVHVAWLRDKLRESDAKIETVWGVGYKLVPAPSMLSLRARLLASFAFVIALSLVGAGFASMWLIRDQQAASAEERIGRLVEPISQRVRQLQLLGAPPQRIAEEMASYARYFDVRILLLDKDNHVTLDTNLRKPAVGDEVNPPPHQPPAGAGPAEAYRSARTRLRGDDTFVFMPQNRQPGAPAGWPFQIQDTSLIVAVPATDVTAAWAKLLPRLLIAGGIAALFSVIAALLLARRITRPIVQMTHASKAMAQGDYSQRIDVHGEDEVAALGLAFNEMAQQVDRSRRAMRQLVADVSHDLKTPLTSIQGFAQAMVDGVLHDDQERAQAAEIVQQEAERMRALVEDLLYLSQIEAGQFPLTLEPLDIDGAVAATAQRFRYQADNADVTVRTALDGAPVLADERRVEQILANLVDNAIRYAPADSEVLLRTARIPGSVLIEVHNGGDPIPEADQPHLFDRFYQVERSRARREGEPLHSGLGLAIVRELVQAHGGDVAVQSSAGAGTVFTVRLPAAAAERSSSASQRSEPQTSAAAIITS